MGRGGRHGHGWMGGWVYLRYQGTDQAGQGKARQAANHHHQPASWPAGLPVAARKVTHLTSRLVAEKNGAARPSATEWVPTQDKPCPQPNRATYGNHAHQGCPFPSRALVLWCEVPAYLYTVHPAHTKYPVPISAAPVHTFPSVTRRMSKYTACTDTQSHYNVRRTSRQKPMDSVAAATRFLCDGYIGKYVPHVGRQIDHRVTGCHIVPSSLSKVECVTKPSIQAEVNKHAMYLVCTVHGSLPSMQLPPVHHRHRWGVCGTDLARGNTLCLSVGAITA